VNIDMKASVINDHPSRVWATFVLRIFKRIQHENFVIKKRHQSFKPGDNSTCVE